MGVELEVGGLGVIFLSGVGTLLKNMSLREFYMQILVPCRFLDSLSISR